MTDPTLDFDTAKANAAEALMQLFLMAPSLIAGPPGDVIDRVATAAGLDSYHDREAIQEAIAEIPEDNLNMARAGYAGKRTWNGFPTR